MTVRVYSSLDAGAPVMTGQSGSLIALLDACLVNGYGSISVTSITQTAGLATATCATPHGYGWVPFAKVLIAGAAQAAYNGEVTATFISPTQFTFPVPGGTTTPATGTITAKKSGSGWSKPYTGTNLAVFRQPGGPSNGMYLRIDDAAAANVARFKGFESMSDLNTGTGMFPTEALFPGGLYCFKSLTADSVARSWTLICNGSIFYLLLNCDSSPTASNCTGMFFGDLASYRSGDLFATFTCGSTSSASTTSSLALLVTNISGASTAHYMARAANQLGSAVQVSKVSEPARAYAASYLAGNGPPFPSPVGGSLDLAPVWVTEGANLPTGGLRGLLPGIWNPLHNKPLSNYDVFTPVGDLAGKTMLVCNLQGSGATSQALFDITDTW